MADTLLSIVLEKFASVAEQQMEEEVRLVVGVKKEVEYLRKVLQTIRAVVADAEKRQVTDERVQVWLERLKDLAYEMDDVVDEWSTAILKLQIENDAPMPEKTVISSSSSCCNINIIPSPFICFKQVALRRDIALKIKNIKEQLDEIESERIRFNFALSRSEEEPTQRLITTSAIDIAEVCGRDMDKRTILDHLLGRGRSCQEKSVTVGLLYIISIVGAGGMGKTTLAQLAYNHHDVKAHFDQRIWVCVSDPFNPIRIFRSIIEILRKESSDLHDLEALQQKVETCISRKKFLLVLDDVWTEDSRLWEQLKNTLICGAAGSRILVTTRKQSVSMMMGTAYMHSLEQLPTETSRALFHQIAFFGKSREKEEELKEVGEKIADKCKGLPLAIKTLGNLMRSKNSKEEWESILNSEVWQLDVFGRDISPALLLSYYDLPPPIKRCFSYCAVFPKDSMIEADRLIKLWMAQGYLNLARSKEMEIVGRDYFEHLAARSLFQDFRKDDDGNIIKCKMHDIVHDFSQWLTKNECFIMEVDNDSQNESRSIGSSLIQKIHHATLIVRNITPNFASTCEMKSLHTLLVEYAGLSSIDEAVLPNLLGNLTCLRSLDLAENKKVKKLPEEVGKLIHLRYLSLSNCRHLRCLPESICDLYNLQTLNLSGCEALQKLPQEMGRLINLRHLQNSQTSELKDLPKGIGRLKSLQTLEQFIVSSDGDDKCQIEDLRNLNNLRGSLLIKGLDEVKDAREAEEAKLKNKIHLHHLSFWFHWKEGRKGVAEALQPQPNLKSLGIYSYEDREWPNWMMMVGSSLTQLKYLCLGYCRACLSLPPLGQLPLLEELEIKENGVKYIGKEFLGSPSTIVFPKLKKLKFDTMVKWEEWGIKENEERSIILPCLIYLTIEDCPKLKRLPDHMLQRSPLMALDITGCPILQRCYQKDIGKDWHKVSHIPKVTYSW